MPRRMSCDILIFEPGAVADEGFPQWWDRVSRWEEPHRLAVAYVSDEGAIVRPPEQPVQSASSVRVDYVVQHSMR